MTYIKHDDEVRPDEMTFVRKYLFTLPISVVTVNKKPIIVNARI
jgi:hypothetical protein